MLTSEVNLREFDLSQTMKTLAKKAVFFAFSVLVLPIVALFWVVHFASSKDNLVTSLSQLFSLVPGLVGVYMRKAALRFFLNHCHWQSHIGFGVILSHADTDIEDGVYIGPQSNIGSCRIGKNTLLGSAVHIMSGSGQHHFDNLNILIRDQGGKFEKVSIGEDCWVGNGALIMANVGKGCVIAAGSVVNKDVPDYAVVAGNPAKVIRMRNSSKSQNAA